ncbi:MAG: hypothetical protein HY033_12895 [Ignavibacteriae bacterium]|nr:hypothetical protein [Ignavibacteria bacterium]MBI3365791.1 hypothetical protein [Ignavibacteriota bacterium]
MKYTAIVLAICCVMLSAAQAQEEGHEKPYLDFWNNWLTPTEYSQQLNYVQNQMKDESQVEKNFKNRRREVLAAEKWIGIGPSHVQMGDSHLSFFGRIRVIHPYWNPISSTQEVYCGASSGGLWYAGPTYDWKSLGDNLPNPSVGAFVIKPDDPKTIFVGTGDWSRFGGAGLFKTADRGLNWVKVPLMAGTDEIIPAAITDLFYNPSDMNTMWLSSSSGVFKSTNGGSTWNLNVVHTAAPQAGVWDMVMNPADPSMIYVALAFGKGVWRTTNAGGEWAPRNFGLPVLDGNVGTSLAIDISRSNPLILYAAQTDKNDNLRGVYKTTNGGSFWEETTSPGAYIKSGQGVHTNVIRIDTEDPNIVYAGSVEFRRTTDGGSTWYSPTAAHGDYTAIEFGARHDFLYVGDDGGITFMNYLFSTDGNPIVDNSGWRFLPSAPIQSYALDNARSESQFMVSGTQDNGTMMTVDGVYEGAPWQQFDGNDGAQQVSIDPNNANYIYFNHWGGKNNNPRLRSHTHGMSSEVIDQGLIQIYYSPISLNKGVYKVLYTVDTSKLWFSTNHGDSWNPATTAVRDFLPGEGVKGLATNVTTSGVADVCYTWLWNPKNDSARAFVGVPGSMTQRPMTLPGNLLFSPKGQVVTQGLRTDLWRKATVYAFSDNPWRIFRSKTLGAVGLI